MSHTLAFMHGPLNSSATPPPRYETTKAGDAVAALKKSLKPIATVKRDGGWSNIDAALVSLHRLAVKRIITSGHDALILLPLGGPG